MNMQQILVKAAQENKVLDIEYHGETRRVMPHTVGVTGANNPAFRAFQGANFGKDAGWRLFKIDEVTDVTEVDETFETQEGYRKNDSAFGTILYQR